MVSEQSEHEGVSTPTTVYRVFSQDERDTILEVTAADPAYMLGLLESTMYDQSVDVTDIAEARIIVTELAHLCATTMDVGTRSRVRSFLEETDPKRPKEKT